MHNLAALFGKSALVVKSLSIDESAEEQVKVEARKSGVISWILSLLGIDSTFTLSIFADRIESTEGSLSGRIKTVIPLVSLDTYTSGFTKPVILLAMAIAMIVIALVGSFNHFPGGLVFFLLALAAVFVVLYFLRKCLLLSFTTNGANGIFFLYKRSVIEGVVIDESVSTRIAEIVKANYIAQTRR